MIHRFTNVHGRCHYGVVIELLEDGAYILSDTWWPNEKTQVPASFAYVPLTPSPYVVAEVKHELLPLDTPVPWQTPEIRQIVERMQAGTFETWWGEHGPALRRKFYGGHKGQPEGGQEEEGREEDE